MIAFSGLRPALVVSQVVLTFGAAQLAGIAAATNYQAGQVKSAQASIAAADVAFDSTVKQVVDDGTPAVNVDPVIAQRKKLQARAIPTSNFFIDRLRIDGLRQRAADTASLTRQVAATETQVEVQLHQQLLDAIKAMRATIEPAATAGLDTAQWKAYADTVEKANAQLSIPRAAQQAIAEVKAKDDAVKQATASKVAADESARQAAVALQNARDNAQAQLAAAGAALQRAKTIPVLKVADSEKAITDLGQQLTQKLAAAGSSVEDFRGIASAIAAQADGLNNLVDVRQSTYDLLSLTRRELDAAQNAKNDVSAERAQVDALAGPLDQAGDLNSFITIKSQVQAIKNSIDAKYLSALYGVGKVIVVSVTQERLVALQDGVVVLDTLVTTGRPSLPTVLGTFHIYFKQLNYHMCTPPQWRGTQYDYGCVNVPHAMEFESSGYFVHDAPWRTHYGPGSDTEGGGTHGCVNVQAGPMVWLYDWTPIGTAVITKQGDLPT